MQKISRLFLPLATVSLNVGCALLLEELSEPLEEASIRAYWLSVLSVTSGGVAFLAAPFPKTTPIKSDIWVWLSGFPFTGSAVLIIYLTSGEDIALMLFVLGIVLPPALLIGRSAASGAARESSPQTTQQAYLNRQAMLVRANNYWVKGVLENSLSKRVSIELGLEERLPELEKKWQTSGQFRQTLPPGAVVSDKFLALEEGSTLLILGEPGSGKTTTLLELARELTTTAIQDVQAPIPVVLNLSCWADEKQTISDWLIEELHSIYKISKQVGQAWVEEQQLVLLLDGFDEVKARNACVDAINQFKQSHQITKIAITSRVKDYKALSKRLQFQETIFISPLSREQVNQYLDKAGLEGVTRVLRMDEVLLQLSKTPLMLNLIALAYQGMSVKEMYCPPHSSASLTALAHAPPSRKVRREHIFDIYIERMFSRGHQRQRYSQAKSRRWLSWLAQRSSQQPQTVFFIEQIQPRSFSVSEDWLETWLQRQMYSSGIGIIGWMMTAPLVGLTSGLASGLILGWFSGLFWNLVVTPLWVVLKGVGLSFIVTFFGQLLLPVIPNIISGAIYRRTLGWFEAGVTNRWKLEVISPGVATQTMHNQKIWQSADRGVGWAIAGALLMMLIAAPLGLPILQAQVAGLLFGLLGGGFLCIEHFTLRLVLYCTGKIPWNYARFLDYATECGFLHQVGDGYIFVHQQLRDHFAAMSP